MPYASWRGAGRVTLARNDSLDVGAVGQLWSYAVRRSSSRIRKDFNLEAALSRLSFTLPLCLAIAAPVLAQKPTSNGKSADPMATVPKLSPLVARSTSDLAPVVERYTADQQSLTRRYDANDSPEQRQRMRSFATAWRARLRE